MARHKKKRAKRRRAGCLACKPFKSNGYRRRGKTTKGYRERSWRQEYKAWLNEQEQKEEL